nr:hypothetical protein [Himastelon rhabdovirus 1]
MPGTRQTRKSTRKVVESSKPRLTIDSCKVSKRFASVANQFSQNEKLATPLSERTMAQVEDDEQPSEWVRDFSRVNLTDRTLISSSVNSPSKSSMVTSSSESSEERPVEPPPKIHRHSYNQPSTSSRTRPVIRPPPDQLKYSLARGSTTYVDPIHRWLTPKGSYQNNELIKNGLRVIRHLHAADQNYLNAYFKFQYENIMKKATLSVKSYIERLENQIDSLKNEIRRVSEVSLVNDQRTHRSFDQPDFPEQPEESFDFEKCLSVHNLEAVLESYTVRSCDEDELDEDKTDLPKLITPTEQYRSFMNLKLLKPTASGSIVVPMTVFKKLDYPVFEQFRLKYRISLITRSEFRNTGVLYDVVANFLVRRKVCTLREVERSSAELNKSIQTHLDKILGCLARRTT